MDIRRKAKMVRPMETTILQGVRNVLLHSEWEIYDVCSSEPGIFELADVEAEFCSHHSEAINTQLHVRVSYVHSTVAAIADKEILNRQMPDTHPSICCIISVE